MVFISGLHIWLFDESNDHLRLLLFLFPWSLDSHPCYLSVYIANSKMCVLIFICPTQVVFTLADDDKDMRLTSKEFSVAFHLIICMRLVSVCVKLVWSEWLCFGAMRSCVVIDYAHNPCSEFIVFILPFSLTFPISTVKRTSLCLPSFLRCWKVFYWMHLLSHSSKQSIQRYLLFSSRCVFICFVCVLLFVLFGLCVCVWFVRHLLICSWFLS